MYAAIYNLETGIIRIGVQGPNEAYFNTLVASGEGYLINEIPVDNSLQAVDVNTKEFVAYQPPKTIDELKAEMVRGVQTRLDSFAQSRGYDGILSAATYATSSIPSFAAEGQYAVDARDQTWATLYTLLEEVQLGVRPIPNDFAEIVSTLPVLVWPQL